MFPGTRTCNDPEEAILSHEVDAVVIASPAATHAELTLTAIHAGKDVLVEKPLALSVGDAEKLVDLAATRDRLLMVGHVLEYHPAVLRLRSLLDRGVLGKVLYLYSNRLNFGKVRTEENSLWSFAPHDIALMLRIMGELPIDVAAHGATHLSEGVADATLMTLGFPRNVPGHVFGTGSIPSRSIDS